MAGILSQAQMPQFSLMGLLLGGRGYASGWFQQRDRLEMAQRAAEAERADRQAFSKSLLASPQWGGYLKDPNSRAALGNLWGQMYGGPESAAQLGSQLLTGGIDAAQRRELADLQHQYQLQETQFSTEEQLRLHERERQDKINAIQQNIDHFNHPLPDGMTAAQKQLADNQMGDLAGIRQPGHDIVRDENGQMIGQVPERGSPERAKIEDQLTAFDSLATGAGEMLFQLDNPAAINRGEWNQHINDIVRFVIPRAVTTGAIGKEEADQLASLFPSWRTAEFTPDMISTAREQLRVMQFDMQKRLHDFSRDTLVPLGNRSGEFKPPEGYYPTEPPPKTLSGREDAVNPMTQRRIQEPLPSVRKSSEGPLAIPWGQGTGFNPRAYSTR